MLQARDMLDMTYREATQVRGSTLAFPHDGEDWTGESYDDARHGMPKDYYDGERSFMRAISGPDNRQTRSRDRAGIGEQRYTREVDHYEAMEQLMYNMLLNEQWQYGATPVSEKRVNSEGFFGGLRRMFSPSALTEPMLKDRAKVLAREAIENDQKASAKRR